MLKIGVTEKSHNSEIKKALKAMRKLQKWDVLVGIPQDKNADHGGITNAELLYIHTYGSPARGIPARPVIQAAIDDPANRKRLQNMFENAFRMAAGGDLEGALVQYEKIGTVGANLVKRQFGVIPPPLKPATIARKGSSATLIDTGQLRNAITYVVRKK